MLSMSVYDSLMFQVYLCCSIDATNNARLGRYMNDAPMRHVECNCLSKACYINKKPCLLVFAARDIQEGEELRYDYGTGNLPWRNNVENPVASTSGVKSTSENPKKQQSVSVENPVALTSGAKSMSENSKKQQNPKKQQSVSVENPVASTSGAKSTSENPKKQQNPKKEQSVSVESPVASTSGTKSTSENPKKQQSVSVENPVASTADGAVVLNSTIEAGLYYVHPQTGILYPREEMEDADQFPLRDDGVEYFCRSAPLVSF